MRSRSYLALVVLIVLAAALSMLVGRGNLADEALRGVFLEIRAMRTLAAFISGAALGVAGVLVQGLFRNPLASPDILGTTAGAVLFGNASLVVFELFGLSLLGFVAPALLLPLGAIVGAFVALLILVFLMRRSEDLLVLLLTGFILSSLFLSISSFLMSLAQEHWELSRALLAFTLGAVTGTGAPQLLFVIPLFLVGLNAAYFFGRPLDLLLSGEEEAKSLGVDIGRTRLLIALWIAVLTGVAVSLSGTLGFVGLIIPHLLRPFFGIGHARLIPTAALAGGAFVILADVLVRAIPSRTEIPLGVITGIIGAPIFLIILYRMYRERENG